MKAAPAGSQAPEAALEAAGEVDVAAAPVAYAQLVPAGAAASAHRGPAQLATAAQRQHEAEASPGQDLLVCEVCGVWVKGIYTVTCIMGRCRSNPLRRCSACGQEHRGSHFPWDFASGAIDPEEEAQMLQELNPGWRRPTGEEDGGPRARSRSPRLDPKAAGGKEELPAR